MSLAENGTDLLERPRLRAKRGVPIPDGFVVDRRDRLGVAASGLSDREAHPGLETWPAGFFCLLFAFPLAGARALSSASDSVRSWASESRSGIAS